MMLIGVGLCACLSGCSSIVRGLVDTQPRVALSGQAFADPRAIVGGEPVAYQPADSARGESDIDPDLVRNAPVIVQGFQPSEESSPRYDRNDDALGSPCLTAEGAGVRVETSEPRLYTRVEHTTVNGVQLKQLVYAFWYPRRPVGSVETGSVDGGVLRITLDAAGHPAVFEYTQPCGCFHGVFVSEAVNTEAAQEFGPVAARRVHAVEPPLTGHDDWVVRDLVPVLPDGRTTLYVSAGKHACQAIRSCPRDQSIPGTSSTRTYALAPYESLRHVARDGGGEGSIFDPDGKVLGAQRGAEQLVFGDLDHAGWPRHLDKMLIHWDSERWTDPTLLATKLRLPLALTDRTAAPVPTRMVSSQAGQAPSQTPADQGSRGRQLLLFTNKRCAGCQLTKKAINESPRLQQLIRGWRYQVVDTATPEGEQLAAEDRVTVVPVLVGFDGDREVFREDDIDTADKIATVIASHESPPP
jgi:hypothetical protein